MKSFLKEALKCMRKNSTTSFLLRYRALYGISPKKYFEFIQGDVCFLQKTRFNTY